MSCSGGNPITQIIPLVLIDRSRILFFMIRPQMKNKKKKNTSNH